MSRGGPERERRGLRRLIRHFRRGGTDRERHERFVTALAGRFPVATVIDVGVGHGTPWLYEAFPDAYHVLVEPVAEFRPDIERILETYAGEHVDVAVGATDETRRMNVEPHRPTRSSFLERTELTRTGDVPESREMRLRPLDDIAAEQNWPPPFGLKVDVEGAEIEVLKGAPEVLARCEFLVVEASLAERFHGGTQLKTLTHHLAQCGFAMTDILHVGFTRRARIRRPQRSDLLFTPVR